MHWIRRAVLIALSVVALHPGVSAQGLERANDASRIAARDYLTAPAAFSTVPSSGQLPAETHWQAAVSMDRALSEPLITEEDTKFLAPPVAAGGAVTASTWTLELVDAAGGAYLSHAYDPLDGRPSVAYFAGNSLRFAHWTGTSWAFENLATGGGTGVGLAYSSSGEPAVSWKTSKGSELRVARKSGSNWSIESVERGVGEFTAIAYDPAGNPAVAYTFPGRKTTPVKFARRGSTGWAIETVDSVARGRYVSIAFSFSGAAAIAYSDDSNADGVIDTLWYATKGASWARERVEGPERGMGVWCDLAFDPLTGEPVIVHSGTTSDGVRFARKGSGGWSASSIEPCDYCGNSTTIAFSATGVPFVGYRNLGDPSDTTEVHVAHWDGSAWIVEPVETLNTLFVSVGVSPSGQATVAYDAFTPGDLRFAWRQ